jgi:uncharacterized damage-inducible protein DinB
MAELSDPRRASPPTVGSERVLLEAWLDYHRATLLLKCDGLDDGGRKRRPVPGSSLSLHGLVRHMADVERHWYAEVLGGDTDRPALYWAEEHPDADLDDLDDAVWAEDLAAWQRECAASRETTARRGLDDIGVRLDGVRFSLRWIHLHMIEEYARHNGHADLIRELVDGSVGD